jgi:hypothetical protein
MQGSVFIVTFARVFVSDIHRATPQWRGDPHRKVLLPCHLCYDLLVLKIRFPGDKMGSTSKRFLLLFCYGFFVFAAVPAFGQAKSGAPTITVYKTPT